MTAQDIKSSAAALAMRAVATLNGKVGLAQRTIAEKAAQALKEEEERRQVVSFSILRKLTQSFDPSKIDVGKSKPLTVKLLSHRQFQTKSRSESETEVNHKSSSTI